MTKDVLIDLESCPPSVIVNGAQVACTISVTYHKEGGLKVKSLTIKNIPAEAS